MKAITLAFILARRELRGGIKGFRIVLACLALGVAAIAGIGSLSRAIEDGLARDARKLLGGDIAFQLVHRPAGAAELAWLAARGTVSTIAELRAMAYVKGNGAAPAESGKDRLLVEVKGVDARYPLFGDVEADGKIQDLTFDYTPKQSSWVALRIFPACHTNPVFVEVDGKPIRASKRSAEWCLNAVDVCWKQKVRGIRESERKAAAEAYDAARQAYRIILAQSRSD